MDSSQKGVKWKETVSWKWIYFRRDGSLDSQVCAVLFRLAAYGSDPATIFTELYVFHRCMCVCVFLYNILKVSIHEFIEEDIEKRLQVKVEKRWKTFANTTSDNANDKDISIFQS